MTGNISFQQCVDFGFMALVGFTCWKSLFGSAASGKAKKWLERAAKSEDKRGAFGVEWAAIHLMNNDVASARLALQEATDLQPKNLQAWTMLAMVQLQQGETTDIEKVILPKSIKRANFTEHIISFMNTS